jgi:hypothetical protein
VRSLSSTFLLQRTLIFLHFISLSSLSCSLLFPLLADITTKRLKLPREFDGGDELVSVDLHVDSITAPLFQLFVPPTTSLTDMREQLENYSENEEKPTIEQWEREYYDLKAHV